MIGCRPLTQNEIDLIQETLKTPRDRALFTLGLFTGFRISEALSLRWVDVLNVDKTFRDRITVTRKNMKGKLSSRNVLVHPKLKQALNELYQSITDENLDVLSYVFRSQKGSDRPISRIQAYRVIVEATKVLNISGPVALHSMRKTFASRVHARLGKDLLKTKTALGHKNINSTISYLSFDTEEIDNAILDMEEE